MAYSFLPGVLMVVGMVLSMSEWTSGGYHYTPPPPPPPPDALTATARFTGPATGPGPSASGFGPGPIGPSAFGPGPAPFSGPLGFGPFPFPPFTPAHGHGPCHLLTSLRKHLPHLLQPIAVAGIGLILLWAIRHILFPYLGLFVARMGRALDDADPTTIDRLSESIRRAIDKGVCLELLACQIGRTSSHYHISPALMRAIKSQNPNADSLMEIFRLAASGQVSSCHSYACHSKLDSTNPYRYTNNSTRTNNT